MGTLLFFILAGSLLVALLAVILAREMVRPPRHTVGYAIARGLPCDPGDLGLDYEEWWLDRSDGARLPVWEVSASRRVPTSAPPDQKQPQPSASATGLTAVFVHGWGHSRIDMLPQATLWSTLCDRMVFYDLRGHGESEHCLSRLGHHEDEDLLALLERLGDGPVVLIGFSIGAVIALATAAQNHPTIEHIRGVIVYGPYMDFHRSLRGRLNRNHLPTRPITDLALLGRRLLGLSPRSITMDDLQCIACPVLVIHGGIDVVAPIEHGKTIAESVRQGELLLIDDTDHALHDLVNHHTHDDVVSRLVTELVHPVQEREGRYVPRG